MLATSSAEQESYEAFRRALNLPPDEHVQAVDVRARVAAAAAASSLEREERRQNSGDGVLDAEELPLLDNSQPFDPPEAMKRGRPFLSAPAASPSLATTASAPQWDSVEHFADGVDEESVLGLLPE